MPLYQLSCTSCEWSGEVLESYDRAKAHICPECGASTELVPGSGGFHIKGFSSANGYHREEIMYDGSKPRQW